MRSPGSSGLSPAISRCSRCLGSLVYGPLDDAIAINDVSIHRQHGNRVANLAYSVGRDEIGRVRCDGLVVATPAGSTGYNLANGGPVMAWGVEGFAVSFISPHSLTARSLVVAPGTSCSFRNRSEDEAVDVAIDGRPVVVLEPGSSRRFASRPVARSRSSLARRSTGACATKFGRLATSRAPRRSPGPGARPWCRAACGRRPSGEGPAGRVIRLGGLLQSNVCLRAACREPAADGAGRAAAQRRPQHPDRRDRRGEDPAGARP